MTKRRKPGQVVATADVHVGGLGACARGAILAADEPLVAARPHLFAAVEPQNDPADDAADDEEVEV